MDKKLAGLIGLFFFSFVVFISLVVFDKPLARFTRASTSIDPSAAQSIVIAFPLTLHANSSEKAQVNVFVRSQTNAPVAGRDVSLNTTLGSVSPSSATTDRTGRATFTYSPTQKGLAQISAVVDNTLPLTQKVTIEVQ